MSNGRKGSTWSQKKIEKLIQFYSQEECLWNPYNENYTKKVKRCKAIEKICQEIDIEPQAFLKKVHNLRNQFNSEYKKLERCMEDAEMWGQKGSWKSKWAHFESLMFLKDVIVRIPTSQPAKRIILESSNVDGELTEYNDTIEVEEDYDETKIEENLQNLTSNEEIPELRNKRLANVPTSSLQLKSFSTDLNKTPQQTTSAVIELATMNNVVSLTPEKHLQSPTTVQQFDLSSQDQWGAFGAFVANELRNLNSDLSRRKLKRKIMQAMLEVAEDDELLA